MFYIDERDSESGLYTELSLHLFVIEGEGLSENGHLLNLLPPQEALWQQNKLCDSSVGT